MTQRTSQRLAELQAGLDKYRMTGCTIAPDGVAMLVRALDHIAREVLVLEEAGRQLAEMEALAQDLDVVERRKQVARASCGIPGTNVLVFPRCPGEGGQPA